MSTTPSPDAPWDALAVPAVADLFRRAEVRWWLSGGVALEHWLGRTIRERENIDVSTVATDLRALLASLPAGLSAWADLGDGLVAWGEVPVDADVHHVDVHDDERGVRLVRVHAEDGAPTAWLYRRDPRLHLAWDKAVLDVDGVPTGAPVVQLVWKALRPRPVDEVDKDAVLPALSEEDRAWWERAMLSIHPHSTWAIHVRSPFAPAKASWNRKGPR